MQTLPNESSWAAFVPRKELLKRMKKRPSLMDRFLLPAATILLLGVLAFSVWQVVRCLKEKDESRQINIQLAEMAVAEVPQPAKPETVEVPAREERPTLPQTPISVDFEQLLRQNADAAAWIYCPDTPINYPVVQGTDNSYYLDHMIDGKENPSGTIFLDHRCAAALTDSYSVIYGHNLKDQAIFGSLPNYADQAYYDAHPIMYLLTPERNFVMELFAGFVTDSDDGMFTLPLTEQTRDRLIETCMARSDFEPQVQPDTKERLIVLSTCSYAYEDARYVVVGMLREN